MTSLGLFLGAGDSINGLAGTAAAITYTILGNQGKLKSRVLAQGQLTASTAVMYSPDTESVEQALITAIILANVTASTVTGVKVGINGSAATAGKQIMSSTSILAHSQAIFDGVSWKMYDSGGNLQLAGAGNTAFAATLPSPTTPLALGVAGTAVTAPHTDHTHQSPGGVASIIAQSSAIVNAEALIVAAVIPATLMQAGTTFRITASGTLTSSTGPGNVVFDIRIGTTTLTGNIAATVTCAAVASVTTQPWWLEALVTVRVAGGSGTAVGQIKVNSTSVTTGAFNLLNNIGTLATPVTVDTTATKRVELTAVTGAATASILVENASIEIVKL